MKLEREDYLEPACVLCGKPGEISGKPGVPMARVLERLRQYEEKNDRDGMIRHLTYWLGEAESLGDERAQLTLHNELMGQYRMRGDGPEAREHAEKAVALIRELQMEDTVTAGTTWLNAGTVTEFTGDPVRALDYFDMARRCYERSLPADDARRGGLYNNMALALTACGRWSEARKLFEKALEVMGKQEHGELEQAITWLNLADAWEAELGPEESAGMTEDCLDRAEALLNEPQLPRNAYYAFVCEKCAPVFGHYGYFAAEAELRKRVREIYEGT